MRPLLTEVKARQSEQAESCIAEQMAKVAASIVPTMDYCAGMIDLAYVIGHFGKERRDLLLEQLRKVVNHRRQELHKQRISRILEKTP
jgi:DNA-binding IclR family transcriptional regulator